jgi:hypothetical protein
MNSLILISPDQGSGFKPILSGKWEKAKNVNYYVSYKISCQ